MSANKGDWCGAARGEANDDDDESLECLRGKILSPKHKNAEKLLNKLMSDLNDSSFKASVESADLSAQERLAHAQKTLADTSIILAHKYGPIIKDFVTRQEDEVLNNKFATIKATPESSVEMAWKYRNCFNTWINAKDDVSIKVREKEELGKLSPVDAFTLLYFTTMTSRRQTGDRLLQLVVSGETTCGKTMIFESPLLDVAHVLTTEKGVSRFNCSAKSTLMLHDVNLEMLVKGGDCDKLKSICRAEPVPTKTHGNVQTVPSIFVFVTANKKLLTHTFNKPPRKGGWNRLYKTDLSASKSIHPSDIAAVQNRYIEAYVRQQPIIPEKFLPRNENFAREHVIVGLFEDIVKIMIKYNKDDFKSQYMYLYPLGALCKHMCMMPAETQQTLKSVVYQLLIKYKFEASQRAKCCIDMNYVDSVLLQSIGAVCV